MPEHPYKNLHEKAFWRRSITQIAPEAVDPVGVFEIRITPQTRIATAGSCFAQHIARYLKNRSFNYYVTEPGHPLLSEQTRIKHNYGLFSARYGNIYTARQLSQLFLRAYGSFQPVEDAWIEPDGSVLDPFRPTSQPGGYVSIAEMHADRKQHFSAVREMFENLDVFIFTLGLTECWVSCDDRAVFPICPGVNGGVFDAEKHRFYNQDVNDVTSDMSNFLTDLKAVNPKAEVILTVSPVPLVATAEPDAHVLAATVYSKSVLRVAAETLRHRYSNVHYFPSYEIITGTFNRGHYFAQDLRNVTEEGVLHVMRLFLHHAAGDDDSNLSVSRPTSVEDREFLKRAEELVQVECDEIALDQS